MVEHFTERVIANVVNSSFTFSDLSPRFKNVDESYGNIFCPFHENKHSPAARMYWDESREIWVLHCFGECHTTYTTYDYVKLVLCKKYNKYKNPMAFLRANMPVSDLKNKLSMASKQNTFMIETRVEAMKEYINNVSYETESIEDYIEKLYTA